jgi:hypothetical protein
VHAARTYFEGKTVRTAFHGTHILRCWRMQVTTEARALARKVPESVQGKCGYAKPAQTTFYDGPVGRWLHVH